MWHLLARSAFALALALAFCSLSLDVHLQKCGLRLRGAKEETTHMQIDYPATHTHTLPSLGHAQLTLTLFSRIIMWFPSGIRACVCVCVSRICACVCVGYNHAHCLSLSARKHLGEAHRSNCVCQKRLHFLSAANYLQQLEGRAAGRHMARPDNPFVRGRGRGRGTQTQEQAVSLSS